jgi:hypothetical protein
VVWRFIVLVLSYMTTRRISMFKGFEKPRFDIFQHTKYFETVSHTPSGTKKTKRLTFTPVAQPGNFQMFSSWTRKDLGKITTR